MIRTHPTSKLNHYFPIVLILLLTISPLSQAAPNEDSAFDFHRTMKRIMYASLTLQSAFKILMGNEQPLLPFIVKENPNSIFINYEIDETQLSLLTDFLALPEGFVLSPIAILKNESPKYYLSLNIYAVSGLGGALSGNRAEWSVYVKNNQGRTSYMVVEARSSSFSLDSVNWFTPATALTHEFQEGALVSWVDTGADTFFSSEISAVGIKNAIEVYGANEWAAANDLIYWGDGVADRTYYDGRLIDTPMLSVDPALVSIADSSPWAQFVAGEPNSVLMFQTGLEFVISPWYNLD